MELRTVRWPGFWEILDEHEFKLVRPMPFGQREVSSSSCVRWYLRLQTPATATWSEMMAETRPEAAGAHYDHAVGALLCSESRERRWNRFARPAGSSWRVDETYVKIHGKWV